MTPRPFRAQVDRLGVRLAFLLAVALFPLLVLAVMQTRGVEREAQARSEAALMGETLRAIAGQTRLIQQAEADTRLLARLVVAVRDDPVACGALMRAAKAVNGQASFIGYIRLDGQMDCASSGDVLNFAGQPRFEYLAAAQGVAYTVAEIGTVSGRSVLTVSYPVRDGDGARVGFVAFSLPHENLSSPEGIPDATLAPGLLIMTFDRSGKVLTSSGGLDHASAQIPARPALNSFAGRQATSFMALSRGGERRTYSVVDLIPGQLYALGSRSANSRPMAGAIAEMPPILFPALMWAASLFVAYFAMQKMVIGHVRRLSRALGSFASGNRVVADLDMQGAPREIRDLAETYEKMTETILHDEAELEDTIHHKEVLLREVHHRVKNNLQLIASIINMQVRRARSPEARAMMKGLQERVISLATVHRGLYMTSGLTDIDANELIRDIVGQLLRATTGPERRLVTEIEVDPIRLTPDQAVPLSLLLTEAMTNAVKYASAGAGDPRLTIRLARHEGDRAVLELRNSLVETDLAPPDPASGLGSQLLNAFAQQMGGTLSTATTPGAYTLRVEFGIRPLNEAELRHDEARAQ